MRWVSMRLCLVGGNKAEVGGGDMSSDSLFPQAKTKTLDEGSAFNCLELW